MSRAQLVQKMVEGKAEKKAEAEAPRTVPTKNRVAQRKARIRQPESGDLRRNCGGQRLHASVSACRTAETKIHRMRGDEKMREREIKNALKSAFWKKFDEIQDLRFERNYIEALEVALELRDLLPQQAREKLEPLYIEIRTQFNKPNLPYEAKLQIAKEKISVWLRAVIDSLDLVYDMYESATSKI